MFCFAQILAFWQASDCWFKILLYAFSNFSHKYPKEGIFGPKLKDFCFYQFDKLEGVDFKYVDLFLNFELEKFQKTFFDPKFEKFFFFTTFLFWQIWRSWYLVWQWFFKNTAQKYRNKELVVQILQIRWFWLDVWPGFSKFSVKAPNTASLSQK